MNSTLPKRKWSIIQNDRGSVGETSSGTTQCHFLHENHCEFSSSSNSCASNSSRSLPWQHPNKMSAAVRTTDSYGKKVGDLFGSAYGNINPLPPRRPFSMETPYISKDTPLVLATARQTGSSIMTSCNTDSVRQLQSSISDTLVTNNVSTEYFSKKTPCSSINSTENSSSVTSKFDTRDSYELGIENITQVRQNCESLSSSSADSQIYMGVIWHGGKLGVAFYNLDTTLLYGMFDIQENDDFEFLVKVLKEINPFKVVVSSKQDERMLTILRNHVPGQHSTQALEEDRSSFLQILPSIDFSIEISKRRVISMNLPSIPEHYTDTERTLYLSSLLSFENICMIRAMGGLLKYLEKMRIGIELEEAEAHLPVLDVNIVTLGSHMILDETAYSALQIFQRECHPSVYKAGTSNSAKEGLSLFGIMNHTKSPIGSRMLRTWFQRPLKDRKVIQSRHAAISYFNNPRNSELVTSLEELVKNVKNISKILTRMMTSQASIGDWQVLYKTVYSATSIKELCRIQSQSVEIIRKVTENFTDDLHQVTNYIYKVVDFQECSLQNRFVVKPNVNENLDKKKRMYSGLPEYLTEVAYQELNKLGSDVTLCSIIYIPQIGYLLAVPETAVTSQFSDRNNYEIEGLEFVFLINNVLHYRSAGTRGEQYTQCISISVPSLRNLLKRYPLHTCTGHSLLKTNQRWMLIQLIFLLLMKRELDTLLGDTRCDITDMETSIMHKLQNNILKHSSVLLTVLDICAELDCLLSLASCAREYNYIRPTITEENSMQVINGRHPIQEICCGTFVPNNIQSDTYGKIKILTGPNACGKSVYLKQVALIVFLAQIGSFVPADEARLGLVDRIFTRVRSQESVSVGLSTFMIDINQMAESLRRATEKSLCIVDEFGKGTDMIDGLSLLCATVRSWVAKGDKCPHVFLSTHFHSIIQQTLIPRSPIIKYMTLETLHNGDELVFLYQLVEGHTSSSYACHVACQAGLPERIIKRGTEVSELIRQCKPVQRCDNGGRDTQLYRCQTVVNAVLDMDLDRADVRSFLSSFVLPALEGNL